jgi:two-component system NtrC family sensor kinase
VRLRARLILIVSLPAVVAVSAHGILRVRQEEAQVRREELQSLALTAAAAQIAVENALRDRQLSDVKRLLSQIVEEQQSVDRIRLFDQRLTPAVVSNPWDLGETVPTEALQRVMTTGLGEGDYQRRGTRSFLSYIVPVRGRSGAIEGALEIVQLAAATDRRVREAVIDILVRLGLLLIVIIVPTALALQRQVIRPLSRLTQGIRELGRDRSGPPLPVDRPDELGEVAYAFNDMALRLGAETERSMDLENRLRRTATVAVAGKLAASLAHEVGTPLNIISGRAEFLLKALPAGDPRREDLEGIVAQIERISRIISSLLDSVRPQGLQLEPTRPAALVDQLFPLLRHTARQREIALVRDVSEDLPAIQADPAQLQQVLINLVLNALDATPAGGRINMSATASRREDRQGVAIAVADNGTGISPSLLPRVFDAFLTTKPRGKGTGLGLAICRDIVAAHDGEISAKSTVGAGSTFTVWIPSVATLAE